jgi:hypothetical protein
VSDFLTRRLLDDARLSALCRAILVSTAHPHGSEWQASAQTAAGVRDRVTIASGSRVPRGLEPAAPRDKQPANIDMWIAMIVTHWSRNQPSDIWKLGCVKSHRSEWLRSTICKSTRSYSHRPCLPCSHRCATSSGCSWHDGSADCRRSRPPAHQARYCRGGQKYSRASSSVAVTKIGVAVCEGFRTLRQEKSRKGG